MGASNLTMRELVTIDGVRAIFEDGGVDPRIQHSAGIGARFEAPSQARLDVIRATIETELACRRGVSRLYRRTTPSLSTPAQS